MTVLFPHQPGDRVRHPLFGAGTVRDVGERYLAIVFDEKGEALVKIDDAVLEPEEGYPGAVPSDRSRSRKASVVAFGRPLRPRPLRGTAWP